MDDGRITAADAVPDDTTYLFTARHVDTGDEREVLLVRAHADEAELERDGGTSIVGWLNYCQHLLDVNIDKGSGAPMRDGELVCANHGAYFESDTGYCTFGPCEGAYLNGVEVAVRDGDVYLTDEDYEFVATGPIDDGTDGPSATSNYEF